MRHATPRTYYGGLMVKAKPTTTKQPKTLTRREQKATFSADAYAEKTPEKKAELAIAYDNSKLLMAARQEAKQNAEAWAKGKPLSYVQANRFADTQ